MECTKIYIPGLTLLVINQDAWKSSNVGIKV